MHVCSWQEDEHNEKDREYVDATGRHRPQQLFSAPKLNTSHLLRERQIILPGNGPAPLPAPAPPAPEALAESPPAPFDYESNPSG